MLIKKTSNSIFRNFTFGKLNIVGRSNTGQITIRHRGSSVSRLYRIVDFINYLWNLKGLLLMSEYDPNRTALISWFVYTNGVTCYKLAPTNLFVSSIVSSVNFAINFESRIGYSAYLKFIKPGTSLHVLEFKPNTPAKYVRSGSTFAKLVSNSLTHAIVKLRSKVLLKISNFCVGTVGIIVNKKSSMIEKRKNAGYNRRLGWRPSVRGVAMNPIDHPHGGGQGKTSGGRPSVTPWAQITKGKKTRRKVTYGAFALKR